MTAHISTFPSGQDYLTYITETLLPSNGWSLVRNTASEKVFELPEGQGFVAFIVQADLCLVSGFPDFDSLKSVEEQDGSYISSLPRFVLPTGSVDTWTVVSGRRVAGVIRSGNIYYSFYAGLLQYFGSSDQYGFPCFIGGSGDVDGTYQSAFPFHGGGALFCPKVCCPDGSWQLVGGTDTSSYTSFNPARDASYIHPFNGRYRNIGLMLDGTPAFFPALVVSSAFKGSSDRPLGSFGATYADDGQWLGYLEGVFVTAQGAANGSTYSLDGINYLVIPNVNRAEQYILRLS